jgi:uncharacterized SAM-binding protein YcdF (DUF218 family)
LVIWATRDASLPLVADLVTYPEAEIATPADAVVVLAGDDGRLGEGIGIRRQGLARELWETGASGATATEKNTQGFVYRALPSSTTWEDALQIREMAVEKRAKRLIVVTSWYHGRRAMRTLEKQTSDLDVEILFRAARTYGYDRSNWWRDATGRQVVKAELLKTVYYLFVYGVSPW